MRISTVGAAVALAIVVTGLHAGAAQGQEDFKLTQLTTTEFGGTLGWVMGLFSDGEPERETMSISADGTLTRSDRDESSTITDWTQTLITTLDHEEETYFQLSLGDMVAQGPMTPAGGGAGEPQGPPPEEADVEYEVEVSLQELDDTKSLLGYEASGLWLRVDATPVRSRTVDVATLNRYTMLSEIWVADDFEGNAAQERMAAAAAEALRAQPGARSTADAIQQAFSGSPALQEAFEGKEAELDQLGSLPLEQTMVFVSLPPGVRFDAEEALRAEVAAAIDIDVAGAVQDAAVSSAVNSARRSLGRFGGLLGGGDDDDEEEEEEEDAPDPVQSVMVRVHELVESHETGPLGDAWWTYPEDYEQIESPLYAPAGR